MAYIAGHFDIKYKAVGGAYVDIGSQADGIRTIVAIHDQPVQDDAFGDGAPDAVQQGADVSVRFDFVEYDKLRASKAMLAQLGTDTSGADHIKINNATKVGVLLSALAGILVATPRTGTSAATDLGAGKSIVWPCAIIASDLELLLSSKLRRGPLTFKCFPAPAAIASVCAIGDSQVVVNTPS